MNHICFRPLLVLGIMLGTFACTPAPAPVGSRYVKSETVTAEQGLTISVSDKQCPELAGTRLVIPAGALAATTEIHLELGSSGLVGGDAKPAGAVAIWGPAGTVFSTPAELTLPYALASGEDLENLFVQVNEADGSRFVIEHSLLSIDTEAKLVRFSINGFTGFQPGTRPPPGCGSGPACSSGQTCVNGLCQTTTARCGQGPACASGQTCINGSCQTSVVCNCGPNQSCLNGVCQSGNRCRSTSECGPNQSCTNGSCQAVTPGCGSGPACAAGETCVNGLCNPAPILNCGSDADCQQGETCLSGTCQTTISGCGPSGQGCTGTDVCVNGICQACSPHNCPADSCGTMSDGCGGTLHCGTCPQNQQCVRNVCIN